MRCMNVCPEQAVQAWQPGLAALIVLSTVVAGAVAGLLATVGAGEDTLAGLLGGQALSWAFMLGAWAAVYGALWLASRWAPVAWLVGHTTFTRLYRRYREPGTDLRKA